MSWRLLRKDNKFKYNLCNFGIIPLRFKDVGDYDCISKGSRIVLPNVRIHIEKGKVEIPVEVNENHIVTLLEVSDRQRGYLIAGGALNFVRKELKEV